MDELRSESVTAASFLNLRELIAEDEGWMLSLVSDPKRDLGDIVLLDAHDFADAPVATIRLPVRVPFSFPGGWAPDKACAVE